MKQLMLLFATLTLMYASASHGDPIGIYLTAAPGGWALSQYDSARHRQRRS